jgi:hypothetical protein
VLLRCPVPAEPALRGLAVRHDSGKWLIQLVCNRGSQFAEHGDARGVGKIGLQPFQHLLGANPLSQVDQTDQADAQVVGRAGACYGELNIDDPSVARGEPRRFLKVLLPAIAAFENPPERAGAFPPDP